MNIKIVHVRKWVYDLISGHTSSNTDKWNHTHSNICTYGLFVHGHHNNSPTHSTNEDQRTAVIAIVVYLNSKIWTSKLLLWCMFGHHIIQDEITIETQVMNQGESDSNLSTHTCTQTYRFNHRFRKKNSDPKDQQVKRYNLFDHSKRHCPWNRWR